ncbi:dihydrofolate reductase [Nematocida sp. ERTm5]|nr:dihydrofolate reductase [Nematocida sp. ERTm5]
MNLTILSAYSEKTGVIGANGRLPWPTLKTDFQFMKYITTKSPAGIIMGRSTFESIGRPLPNRTTIVLTSQMKDPIFGSNYKVYFKSSLDAAVSLCKELDLEPIVFGGNAVYSEAIKRYNCTLYLTEIYKEYSGDAFFPLDLIDRSSLIDITEEVKKELKLYTEDINIKKIQENEEKERAYTRTDGSVIDMRNTVCENNICYSFLKGRIIQDTQ